MNRVKEFRKELGISQLELAKDIGVSRQTINMIEMTSTIQLWNSVSISPAVSKLTSIASFGKTIFKKGANKMKKETLTEKTHQTHIRYFWSP